MASKSFSEIAAAAQIAHPQKDRAVASETLPVGVHEVTLKLAVARAAQKDGDPFVNLLFVKPDGKGGEYASWYRLFHGDTDLSIAIFGRTLATLGASIEAYGKVFDRGGKTEAMNFLAGAIKTGVPFQVKVLTDGEYGDRIKFINAPGAVYTSTSDVPAKDSPAKAAPPKAPAKPASKPAAPKPPQAPDSEVPF